MIDWVKALPLGNCVLLIGLLGVLLSGLYALSIRSFSVEDPSSVGNVVFMFSVVGLVLAVTVTVSLYAPGGIAFWFQTMGATSATENPSNAGSTSTEATFSISSSELATVPLPLFACLMWWVVMPSKEELHLPFDITISPKAYAAVFALVWFCSLVVLVGRFVNSPSWSRALYYFFAIFLSGVPAVILIQFVRPDGDPEWIPLLYAIVVLPVLSFCGWVGGSVLDLQKRTSPMLRTTFYIGALVLAIFLVPALFSRPFWFVERCAVLIGLAEERPVRLALKAEGCKALIYALGWAPTRKPCLDDGIAEIEGRPVLKSGKIWQIEFEKEPGTVVIVGVQADQVVASERFTRRR